jgi:2-polyprenyl-3-methyl-5-hydroxy-6-metoxy-1,4-benzoquinol methylase
MLTTAFKKRSYKKELIDLGEPHYTAQEYDDCLEKLGAVGRWLGGDRATKKAFSSVHAHSILDVGCGGGFTAKLLSKKFKKSTVLGIDMSRKAIDFCLKRHPNDNSKLRFEYHENKGITLKPKSVDVITSTLVCHHMDDSELVDFLKQAQQVAKKEVIINDLHRHPLAYFFYYLTAPLLFKNRLISQDGLLSIKRAFIKSDWQNYLKQADISPENYQITWYFPFRYIVKIQCNL